MSSTRSAVSRRARPVISNPRYGHPGRSSRRGRRVAVLGVFLLLVLVGVGILGGTYWSIHRTQGGSSRSVIFHVNTGDTVTSVADRLHGDGLVQNTLLFRIDARLRGLASRLKVGDYTLRANMSVDQTVSALSIYHPKSVAITIPEGFRIEQTAAVLDAHGMSGTAFLREARHPTDLHYSILAGRPAHASLEGFLFPNTYDVPPHYSGKALAREMVSTLDKSFTAAMRARATAEHMSVYQVLTLASIVEREARVADERPKIASVYLNRLSKSRGAEVNWRLQADPTVQYIVGTSRDWWPPLTVNQLHVSSPYNTYLNAGLPPGPIASPGISSILAVLYPAHTHYLYFVARGHGRHAFARTYQEQLKNQQKYAKFAQ